MSLGQTERLLLSKPSRDDMIELHSFLGDPDVMSHSWASPSLLATIERVVNHEVARQPRGYAPWVLKTIDTEEIVGWGGLSCDPYRVGWALELSFYFKRIHWGKGYASELIGHCVKRASRDGMARQISAFVHQMDIRSQRVLERYGFGNANYDGMLDRIRYEYCIRTVANNLNTVGRQYRS